MSVSTMSKINISIRSAFIDPRDLDLCKLSSQQSEQPDVHVIMITDESRRNIQGIQFLFYNEKYE